jgi:hypothetical protein
MLRSCALYRKHTSRMRRFRNCRGRNRCEQRLPLLDRRGGCAEGTDGVVVQTRTKQLNNHPVRSLSMLRDFFDVAATPPVQEG